MAPQSAVPPAGWSFSRAASTAARSPRGEVVHYQFNRFTWFSRKVSKGSRLRLVVDCPNSIQVEKNYNSGGVVADETVKDARTAHVALYHDAEHPSVLEIPIVK